MFARTVVAAALALTIAADPAYIKQVEAWRAKHEADYRRDWVTISGLFFLEPGPNRAGSASSNDIVLSAVAPPEIGAFILDGTRVRFEPRDGVAVMLKDQPVTAPLDLVNDGGKEPADVLVVNGLRLTAHVSGERRSIRVRDANGATVKAFLGFRWFPIDDRYRVVARFIKDPAPREVVLPNLLGDSDAFRTEGVVEFTLNGKKIRMRPMTTRPGRLFFIFKDASSGHETYSAARFVYSDLRDDGTTVLDFNQAYNPPCAFNPYTTCPYPPAENRLTIKILAGEKAYPAPHPTQ